MTGYLAALAMRELGDAGAGSSSGDAVSSAVTPRRVSAYESVALPAAEVETSAVESRAAVSPRVEMPSARDDGEQRGRGEPLRAALSVIHAAAQRAAHDPGSSARGIHSIESNVASPAPRTNVAVASGIATPAHVAAAPTPAPIVPSATQVVEMRDLAAEPAAPRLPNTQRKDAPAHAASVVPSLRPPVSVLVIPRRAETRPAAEARSRDTAPGHPPPQVVVTIGRIEVRAVPAPTQPRPARAARATMSLDDYLSERSRGLR